MRTHDSLTVLTWNLHWITRSHARAAAKRDLLLSFPWDIALLQEVGPRIFACLAEAFPGSVYAHQLHDSGDRYPHAVAILARGAATLRDARLVPVGDPAPGGFVQPERAMAATAIVGRVPMTVVSWHAPHAAGRSMRERQLRQEQKMRAYRAVQDWIVSQQDAPHNRPLVLGADVNSWMDAHDLAAPDLAGAWYEEHRFHGASPAHGLVDVYRRYLEDHPAERDAVRRDRPTGPLAVTYDRGHGGRSIPCRMDRLYTTSDFGVHSVVHHPLTMAHAAGSDHAIVSAVLAVPDEVAVREGDDRTTSVVKPPAPG